MEKVLEAVGLFLALACLAVLPAQAQMMQGRGGMMGGPMGRDMGPGMMTTPDISIPDRLPKPRNEEWTRQLDDVLALERHSKAQYEHDSAKYRASMPYMMVEPQEEYHIRLITRLFDAYGIRPNAAIPPVKRTQTLEQAYSVARELEADLIPRYERLIAAAEAGPARDALEIILGQTRMHYRMFSHAMSMGGMGMRGR
jgi:Spy/CpxP family protein refolding chaperone